MATIIRAAISLPLPKGKKPSDASLKKGTVHGLNTQAYTTTCGKHLDKKDARWMPVSSGKDKDITCERCKAKLKSDKKEAVAKAEKPKRARKPSAPKAQSLTEALITAVAGQ